MEAMAAAWNQLMHALHGNTPSAPTDQHTVCWLITDSTPTGATTRIDQGAETKEQQQAVTRWLGTTPHRWRITCTERSSICVQRTNNPMGLTYYLSTRQRPSGIPPDANILIIVLSLQNDLVEGNSKTRQPLSQSAWEQ